MANDAPDQDVKAARPVVARYRKVLVTTWDDPAFRALSAIAPCGQGLLLYLKTGPHTGAIPGLSRVGRAALAEELGWELEAFEEAFEEAFQQGLAKADWKARVMWLPGELQHNRPESPNVVKAWASAAALIPDCDLKREALAATREALSAMGDAFAKAWDEASAEPSPKPSAKPSPKASPKPRANQDKDKHKDTHRDKDSLFPDSAAADSGSGDKAPKKPATSAPTWDAYSAAFRKRYGADPLRDAKVNTILCRVVASLGVDEAPAVAAFYVDMSDRFYIEQRHPVSLLERDLQKVRTTWATGSSSGRNGFARKDYTKGIGSLEGITDV